ncbi:MAG: sialidase, partial [Candidatus Eremiobacteraeota bacterium]|nr:sialidase [Candidatus Eremiobacteraeota bacterium]
MQFGSAASPRARATISPPDFGVLKWREIGPAVMGGRLDAVAGVPGDGNTIYLGHSSGGLYKSTDAGMTFTPVFHAGTSSSIGAIAVAPSDSKTIYAGTGEGFPRNTAGLGDGVFISRDAGTTWHAAGLAKTEHIARLAVDPHDPSNVLAAAMGPEFNPGGDRGIFRTTDGGKHWTRTLW